MMTMTPPSLCGSFIGNKKAMLAFTWTITTLFTFLAFLLAIAMVIQINSHYRYLERYSYTDDNYRSRSRSRMRMLNEDEEGDNQDGDNQDEHSGDSGEDQEQNWYPLLAATSSGAMTFVAMYTMVLATALSLYGSTAIVGFTSLRGVYIAPCFSHKSRLITGIFGGAVVVFANLLLLTAVIFGEFRVEDYRDQDQDEMEPYAVERISTVLAVTCMFLSILYACFAVLLFLAYASDSPSFDNNGDLDSAKQSNTQFILGEDRNRHSPFISMTTAEQDSRSKSHSQFIIPRGEEAKVGQFITMSGVST